MQYMYLMQDVSKNSAGSLPFKPSHYVSFSFSHRTVQYELCVPWCYVDVSIEILLAAITRHKLIIHPPWTWRKTKNPGVHMNRRNVIYSDKMTLNKTNYLLNFHTLTK
jgi:hypothetical protein